MLKLSRIVFGIILVFAVATACEAPAGSDGPQGPQGEVGPIGPAGEDGSMMYAGAGEPSEDVGDIGDYYLNQDTGELHGPKDADGWGNPIIVLMGEDGEDGADGQDGEDGEDGSQILSGDGPPSVIIGKTGDFYLDKTNFDLYGPKSAPLVTDAFGSWGTPINIKGAEGNANVTRYIFTGHDFSTYYMRIPTIPDFNDLPEESVWIVYLKKNNWMHHIPGWGSNGNSQYNVSHVRDSNLNLMFYISLQSGSGEAYDNIYVVRIESSNTEDMSKQKSSIIPDHLDMSDYKAVAKYYGFYK